MNNAWYTEILNDHPILFCLNGAPEYKSCICRGFECGEGWKDPLEKLSDALEDLNMIYWPKWHVRIQAEQVKQKFGTLRFYYSTVIDMSGFRKWSVDCLKSVHKLLCRVNYNIKANNESANKIENHLDIDSNCLTWPRIIHREPTKNVFLWKLKTFVWNRICIINSNFEPTAEQQVIKRVLDTKANNLIGKAFTECHNTCEACGRQIGVDYSPRCNTTGYIRYLCKDCMPKT